jgi:phage terminase large subunit
VEFSLAYEPRDVFIPYHQRDNRFSAMVAHRRAGKTVACIGELVTRAMYTKKKRAEFAYCGPYRAQAKKIAWAYLKDFTDGLRVGNPRESDLSVTLHTGATITLYGADNPDSLRGLFFDGIVLDEYGDMRPSIWGEVVLPTLLDRGGWATFIGTPKGKNHFYHMVQRAKTESGWYEMTLKASESGLLDDDAIELARAEMTDSQYQQEMECSFDAAVQGSYYSDIVAKMEVPLVGYEQARIGSYPYDPTEVVYVSTDLGFTDSTAMWFWQLRPDGPILIDYEEHDSEALEFYFEMLKEKKYDYADVWLPHDAKATSLQTGRSTVEQFLEQGFPCKVVPKLAVQHGIDAARLILPQCRINKETCYGGIEALRAYRRSFNEKTQQFSNKPLHDWASNGSDAFRYFSLVTELEKSPAIAAKEEDDYLSPVEYTLDQLYKSREEDNWRSAILRI